MLPTDPPAAPWAIGACSFGRIACLSATGPPNSLTGNHLVSYHGLMQIGETDTVFRALADPTRRALLDSLFERDGQTLVALTAPHDMTRIAVAKHLRLLEDAGLVVSRRRGREKLHYLNPVPIRAHP